MEQKKRHIQSFIRKQNIPNILMYGPYLNGKEELCTFFIRMLYPNSEDHQKYVLCLNCLNTSGIQSLKEHIKLFSMQIIHKTSGIFFKTIVLKHAEYLTYDSQYSLRRTIEQYSNHTRFVLLCENKNKLLQPICSRFVHIYLHGPKSALPYVTHDTFPYYKYKLLMKTYDVIINEKKGLHELMLLAQELYEHHFFAHEILAKFKKHDNYYMMCSLFDQYRKEFRNEVLCIFYLLHVFRRKPKIQILDVY